MAQPDLTEAFAELVRRASSDLPEDVEEALLEARGREEAGSAAESALGTILDNVRMAREQSTPICQDTGTPIFYVRYPEGWSARLLRDQIRQAVASATELAYLRPNAVDAMTGMNTGDNRGTAFPAIHFEEWEEDHLKVDLLLKGGGCENVGAQYALPHSALAAGRDLEGVRRVVLDAVHRAQGKGCAPGILGVAIGGDRGSSYVASKEQLLRPLSDKNPDDKLAALEDRLTRDSNELGIGPMGFGGQTTVLSAKVGALHRLPASYFVSVSYMCWADRRASMAVRDGEAEFD